MTIQIALWLVYLVPAALLMVFGINLYIMLGLFYARRRKALHEVRDIMARFREAGEGIRLPRVVSQLPVYNEFNVVERAMLAVARMDYPADLHTLQVLDDSTDDTRRVIDRVAEDLRARGHRVEVIRRPDRVGFKAGALDYGMGQTDADFFAIFDADFVPPRDFLMRTVAVMLARADVGLVQARWGHLNPDASMVTRAQAVGIDGHFAIEQPARAWNNLFMNFNGTAGLWRRQAIVDAGGWEHDTLTEDMDLSYRSQLAGWQPFYLSDLVVPAELPESINAFKSQQFRWAKGSMQTALKLMPRVMRSPRTPFAKLQALLHMTHYAIHPIMVWLSVFALPLLAFTEIRYAPTTAAVLFGLILFSAVAPLVLYSASQIALYPRKYRRLRYLPLLSVIGVGIAISNTRAVMEALAGKPSAFIRTPKKGDRALKSYRITMPYAALFELALGSYCFLSLWYYLHFKTYAVGPFLFLYAIGFTSVGLLSITHALIEARQG